MDRNEVAVSVFDKRAKAYQDKYMDTGRYHATLDLFCNNVRKNGARILEIACGPGNVTRYLLQKRPDFQLLGIDLAPNMLKLAAANNPDATFELMDGRKVGQLNQRLDGIVCGFFLPYLSKEEAIQFIHDAGSILATDGLLYISTMVDDYAKSGIQTSSYGDQLYIYFHQADYLTAALLANGFAIVEQWSLPPDLVILAAKR